LLYTFFTVLLLAVAYLLVFRLSIGSYTKSEWWVREIYQYKEYIASNIKQPKIIIASGSNSLFGINSGLLEKVTGYPVANLAVHGALDIDFLYYKLLDHVNEGDIVVMPIEFGMYVRDFDNEWFSNNMISWGYDDFLEKLPVKDKFMFVIQVPKERVVQGIANKYLINGLEAVPSLSDTQVVANLETVLRSGNRGAWMGYNFKSLNKYGDMNINQGPTQAILDRHKKGIYFVNFAVKEHFFSVFQKISKLVEKRNAKLILTWQVSVRNEKFDLSTNKSQDRTNRFKSLLAGRGIDIHCNPALFNLDVRFFFNSINHLNKYGAMIRSRTLGNCINSLLSDENYQEKGFAESVKLVKHLEAKYFP